MSVESQSIAPHGGMLVNRTVSPDARVEIRARAAHLPGLELTSRGASDLLLLATGAFSPLEGFMNFDTARSVVEEMRLPNGMLWSLPVLLQVERVSAASIPPGGEAALQYEGALLGTLK